MADCQDLCEEEEVPGGSNSDASGDSGQPNQTPTGARTEEGGSCPRDRLEEEDQAGTMWEKEEGEEVEEEEEEADTASDTTGDEEEVDPRVAENLEIMNQSCAEVNRLENELDEARSKYRSTFQASSHRMEELGGKMKRSIQRARHYFELNEKAKQAQNEALRAARQYQTANGNYRAAIEMVTLAEKGLDDNCTKTRTLSSAWQETLNHAVERVTEAERAKTCSETEHNRKAAVCAQLESQIHSLEKKYKRSIAKARPYFETKAELELKLQQLKQNVWDLQQAISIRKVRYAEALRCLEAVSIEIHESRQSRKKMMLQFPREPGVGAETDSLGSNMSDANIERGIFSSSSSTAFLLDEEDDDDESDDVIDALNSDMDNNNRQPSRSLSRRSNPKQQEAEDSRSSCSLASGSVFSRSVSNASVFSSEGYSDSASESPYSPSAMSPTAPCYPVLEAPTSSCGTTPSLMDMARGDLGSRQQDHVGEGQGLGAATTSDGCRNSADLTTRTTAGVQDSTEDAKDLQNLSGFLSADCEREAGDGSAQEDCPREADSSGQLTLSSQSSLCSQFSSVLTPSQGQCQSQEQAFKAADSQHDGMNVKTGSGSVVSPPQGVNGEVKKMPLRRTDAPAHRPLQGIMLLNPSDLAASSFHFGPRI